MKSNLAKIVIIIDICILMGLAILGFLYKTQSEDNQYNIGTDKVDNNNDIIIVLSDGEYTGRFPDVIQTEDELIAAFYWNKIDSHAPWNYGDSLGTIKLVHGSKDGVNWSDEYIDFIGENFLVENNIGVWRDCKTGEFYYSQDEANKYNAEFCVEARDPNFAKLNDGTIIFTFFTRLPYECNVGGHTFIQSNENNDYTSGRTYIMYSRDACRTWSYPVEIPCNYLDGGCVKRGNIAVYKDNQILIPLYGYNSTLGTVNTSAMVLAELAGDKWIFITEYNTHISGNIEMPGVFIEGVNEISLTVLGENTYALCRSNGDVLVSSDRGKNWKYINIMGGDITIQQPSLNIIPETNQLIASWAESSKYGGRDIYMLLFNPIKDNWWRYDNKRLIFTDEVRGDMGDPTSIYIGDGKIYTIYYDVPKGIIGGHITSLKDCRKR